MFYSKDGAKANVKILFLHTHLTIFVKREIITPLFYLNKRTFMVIYTKFTNKARINQFYEKISIDFIYNDIIFAHNTKAS